MALPVLMALAAQILGPQPRPISAAPSRPALAFDQYMVYLGPVAPSEEVLAHFDFKNRGSVPVTDIQLVPSCGCLQPQLKKQTYGPGEAGNFVLRVQTANQNAGLKEYTVAVKYNDPEPREAVVVFRVYLPENQVFVRPRALILYQPGDEAPPPQHIEITDRRGPGRNLNITRVECTRPVAQVDVEESTVDKEGDWHGHLKVTVLGNLPPGRVEAMIRIVTDDPEYHLLRVPLILQGGPLRKIVDPHVQSVGGTR
jgi:hypothetical protein